MITIVHDEIANSCIYQTVINLAKQTGIKEEWIKIKKYNETTNHDKYRILCGQVLAKKYSKKPVKNILGKVFTDEFFFVTICYSLGFIMKSSIEKCKHFKFCLEVMKNVVLVQKEWEYENGRIRIKGKTGSV